ncbi:hypothetical protein GV828_08160 [Flavobacterium sp. NST-5]|uniref:Serine/threonine protein kinase n=1 Tax=Flavobacterium ichthyis TaxID=2698827 RepID=A0ABW9Z909_9FLAO|nr:hypothetical protein [Flavobacterium ichthyis]NBL65169.1 hypothetical protein [Flavobacterium ichthyis]
MKKMVFTMAFLATFGLANAQNNRSTDMQTNQDQLQQLPPPSTQNGVERAAKVEATKRQSNSEIEAEMKSKDKGKTDKFTKVNPNEVGPVTPDTVKRPQNPRIKPNGTVKRTN